MYPLVYHGNNLKHQDGIWTIFQELQSGPSTPTFTRRWTAIRVSNRMRKGPLRRPHSTDQRRGLSCPARSGQKRFSRMEDRCADSRCVAYFALFAVLPNRGGRDIATLSVVRFRFGCCPLEIHFDALSPQGDGQVVVRVGPLSHLVPTSAEGLRNRPVTVSCFLWGSEVWAPLRRAHDIIQSAKARSAAARQSVARPPFWLVPFCVGSSFCYCPILAVLSSVMARAMLALFAVESRPHTATGVFNSGVGLATSFEFMPSARARTLAWHGVGHCMTCDSSGYIARHLESPSSAPAVRRGVRWWRTVQALARERAVQDMRPRNGSRRAEAPDAAWAGGAAHEQASDLFGWERLGLSLVGTF